MAKDTITSPFTGSPVITEPITGDDVPDLPPQTFFELGENGDKTILEDNSGFVLTEMAM